MPPVNAIIQVAGAQPHGTCLLPLCRAFPAPVQSKSPNALAPGDGKLRYSDTP